MTSPSKLPADKRVKVANEVRQMPHIIAISGELMIMAYDRYGNRTFVDSWDPAEILEQKDALVQKVAQLIEAMPYIIGDMEKSRNMRKFISAISANNTDDLENLCYELMSGEVND